MQKKSEAQILQNRISKLEQQLADAQATILSLKAESLQSKFDKPLNPRGDISLASDEGFKQALLVAPYPLMIWREDGIVLMVNAAFSEISGYTLEDIPTFEDWSHKAFADRLLEQSSLIFYEELPGTDVKKSREFEITTRTGDKRIWDFSYAILGADEIGRGLMIAMAVDITERRQIEQLMDENERKSAIIFNKAPFAAALSKLPDGVITDVNEEFERTLGYTRNETLGRTSLDIGFNPNQEERALILEQFKKRGSARNVEAYLRTKSGEMRNFLLNLDEVQIGGQRYIFQTAQDITERKRSEQALRDSEELFSKAFHKSPFGMNITRWKDGVILDANPAWLNLLGWTREEVLGKSTSEFPFYARPEDRSWVRERITTEEVSGDMELHIVRKEGTNLIVNVATTMIDLQGERCILGVLNDITKRRQAEEALRESEERYRAVIENAVDAIIVTDPAEGGKVLSANPAACKMFGYSQTEFKGLDRAAMIDLTDSRLETFLKNRDQRGHEKGELIYLRHDGTHFPGELTSGFFINQNGQQNSIAIIRDITERKKAEQALWQSEQRYRGLFESMQEGLIAGEVIADESGRPINFRYLEVNPAIERQYGIPRQKFIGRTYTEVLPEGDRAWIEILGSVAITGEPASVERFSEASGKWFEAHAYSPLRGQFVNILTDITERKKAEEALQRFQLLSEHSRDIMLFIRYQGGDILEANAAAVHAYGYSRAELLGLTISDLRGADTSNLTAEQMTQANQSGILFETIHRHKDGSNFPVEVSSQGATIGGIRTLVSIVRDITVRKKVEGALEASEAKMRAVFRALTEGVVFLNPDGNVEEANDAVQLIFGHTIEELVEPELDPRHTIIRPDGTPFPVQEQPGIVALRTGNTVRDVELGVHTRNGNISWRLVNAQPVLNDQGALLGAVVSFFDITERKLAEQAMRESEERFRSLANSMPQLVWTALPDGRVDYYNQRHLEYKNIKQIREQDWDWAPVLHPEESQATVNAWLHSVKTGEVYQIEHRVQMSDGSYRWHLSRGVPILDDKGQILRWFGTATDIHDLKLAEEQTKVYASRLEKSNRELEHFAFMASHDLQEPLRKIEMFGDLLLERATSLQDNERMYLDRMRNAANRMRGMIEGLLQISRVATQGKPFVRVNLSRIIQEVLSDFEDQIMDADGIVEVGKLPAVNGDPLQLRQLMQNLIGNALKYRQPGKPPELRIFAEKFPEKVQISIQDKGIGFSQADADRIFEPFQRLVGRNQYDGSGIGLSICRRIVERHGGEITAMSEPGQGTTFMITLPNSLTKESKKES